MKSTPHKNPWRRALAAGLLVILVPAALAVHKDAAKSHAGSAAPPPVIAPAPVPDTSSDAPDPAPSTGSEAQPADPDDPDVESSDVAPEDSGSNDADSYTDTDTTTDETDAADPTPGYLDPGETSEICAGGAVCDPTTALPYFQPGGGLAIPND